MSVREYEWRPSWPCPVGPVWSSLRRGVGDPTYRVEGEFHWRALATPEGPVTLAVTSRPGDGAVRAAAWGAGAEWALAMLPRMLGAEDDPSPFLPRHPVLAEAWRRHRHWRIGRGGQVWAAMVPAVIEQKVTGQEAFAGYRRLVRRHGEPAPGPHPDLWLPPGPLAVARIASWEWLRLGIDPARSATLVAAARVADALERTLGVPPDEADRRLRSLPGIGVWTSAEIRSRAHGDPDAVSFGDYHVARSVTWALTGTEGDDAAMAEVLQPYAGQRYRVQRLLELSGLGHPRRGPRMAPRRHLPVR